MQTTEEREYFLSPTDQCKAFLTQRLPSLIRVLVAQYVEKQEPHVSGVCYTRTCSSITCQAVLDFIRFPSLSWWWQVVHQFFSQGPQVLYQPTYLLIVFISVEQFPHSFLWVSNVFVYYLVISSYFQIFTLSQEVDHILYFFPT